MFSEDTIGPRVVVYVPLRTQRSSISNDKGRPLSKRDDRPTDKAVRSESSGINSSSWV